MIRFYLFLLFACLFFSPLPAQIDLNRGLIADFPFCGNAQDESSNTNDGTLYGPHLVPDRFGHPASAYAFDGIDDYIDCGNDISLNQAFTGLTVSAWIKLAPGGEIQQQIIGKWNNTIPEDHFTVLVSERKIVLAVANPWYSARGYFDDLILEDDQWYHILVTWKNDGTHQIYIDKTLSLEVVSTQFDWISTSSDVELKIGRQVNPAHHNRAFNGTIDDVRIYDRVLDSLEIDSLYHFDPKQVTTSTSSILESSTLLLQPNPASDFFQIRPPISSEPSTIRITSITGQLLAEYRQNSTALITIPTTGLPNGIVMVTLDQAGKIHSQQLLIQKN